MTSELESFLAERNKALADLDMAYARRMFPNASSDEVLLITLHMARLECTQLPTELRHASGRWLAEHGYRGMNGVPYEGLLPV